MKYSLQTLMVVVTLAAVLLGGRIEYLRRWGTFHEREAQVLMALVAKRTGLSPEDAARFAELQVYKKAGALMLGNGWAVSDEELQKLVQHRYLAEQFRQAAYRPWNLVDEIPPQSSP
jgi:hypothetical protein